MLFSGLHLYSIGQTIFPVFLRLELELQAYSEIGTLGQNWQGPGLRCDWMSASEFPITTDNILISCGSKFPHAQIKNLKREHETEHSHGRKSMENVIRTGSCCHKAYATVYREM